MKSNLITLKRDNTKFASGFGKNPQKITKTQLRSPTLPLPVSATTPQRITRLAEDSRHEQQGALYPFLVRTTLVGPVHYFVDKSRPRGGRKVLHGMQVEPEEMRIESIGQRIVQCRT
jgi:hypothetical protein